ncbi:MAG: dihydropteroate synthase [Bermanella sp.]
MKLRCGDRILDLACTQVMGVLNATPDSFSDGGQFQNLAAALKRAGDMHSQGAAIIDVGGESTRPGAVKVSLQQELDRVIPVVESIARNIDVCISVDSSSPEVMLAAKKAGAHMLNDVRALQRKDAMQAAKSVELPVCIMHMQGEPDTMQKNPAYNGVLDDIYVYLAKRIQACNQMGIDNDQILIDPGFGFGKTAEHNYQLLAKLERLKTLGVPVLVGLSRKSMIGAALGGGDVSARMIGSVAGAVIAAMNGAHIVRVHDVKETFEALEIVKATKRQW